jgi:NAD(P)-dependent dehydrogenase (short-subunit alcohol dehydrogenase family)
MGLQGIDGNVAIVTGGASGMGAASSRRLSDEGASVVVVDINEEGAEKVAASLDGPALAIGADVSTEEGVQAYVDAAVAEFGRVDLFHNNAGYGGDLVPTWEMTTQQFDHTMGVNCRGVFFGLRSVMRQMLKQGDGGAIVNTASMSGRRGIPGQAAYAASKHAVIGMTKVAAMEGGPLGIRVNALCPGLVLTPMLQGLIDKAGPELVDLMVQRVPLGRMAQADEVANLATWLLSDEASYLNGEDISVDGGIGAG